MKSPVRTVKVGAGDFFGESGGSVGKIWKRLLMWIIKLNIFELNIFTMYNFFKVKTVNLLKVQEDCKYDMYI